MIESNRLSCCGIIEIGALSLYHDPAKAMADCVDHLFNDHDNNYAYVLFSGNRMGQYAKPFRDYIIAQGLGSVVGAPIRLNTNSGNKIKAWLWSPSKSRLRAWARAQKITIY